MKRSRKDLLAPISLILTLLLFTGAHPPDPSSPPTPVSLQASPYSLEAQVISAAGSPGTGQDLHSVGSLGQPSPVGHGISAEFQLHAGFWSNRSRPVSGVDIPSLEPGINRLVGVRPNPFNPSTEIALKVGTAGMVALRIHDLQGRRVRTLVREKLTPGLHSVNWNGRDDAGRQMPSGVYFVNFKAGAVNQTIKVLLVK